MGAITGRALCPGGGGTAKKLEFTYTGEYNERADGVVELLSSGTFNLLKETAVDIFAVGGGGGGSGARNSGGIIAVSGAGGGGYTVTRLNLILSAQEYEVTIGAGGAGVEASAAGKTGGQTIFGSLVVANGGIGGYSYGTSRKGGDGGSGGASGGASSSTPSNGGSDGSDGGTYRYQSTSYAGGTGQGTTTREFGEETGNLYAGGGGAGTASMGGTPGQGGLGGGGNGGTGSVGGAGENGQANTGGGGGSGGGNGSYSGGAGGSGIVCIRVHKAA